VFAKVLALPGVRRHQTGETEIRAVFPPAELPQVARVIRARVRRVSLDSAAARRLGAGTAYRAPSRTQDGSPAPSGGRVSSPRSKERRHQRGDPPAGPGAFSLIKPTYVTKNVTRKGDIIPHS